MVDLNWKVMIQIRLTLFLKFQKINMKIPEISQIMIQKEKIIQWKKIWKMMLGLGAEKRLLLIQK